MKKSLIAITAALSLAALPSAAFAAKPVDPGHQATTNNTHAKVPTVMFVLRGNVTAYSAFSAPSTKGSITLTVTSSNRDKAGLKTQSVTLVIGEKTKVVLHKHQPVNLTSPGDRVIVKVRALKNTPVAPTTGLNTMTAFQVIDQGAAK